MKLDRRHRTETPSSPLPLELAAALLAALLGLAGCGGPKSVARLRAHPHRVWSFEVPADCATVYLRIARRAQERYQRMGPGNFQPGVTVRLAPDRQSATVTLFDAGGLGLQYVLTAELHALDSAHTTAEVYSADRAAAQEALLWQQWANTPLENPQESPPSQEGANPPEKNP
jgi:hypothetical protein